ncbi:MAG: hypothetical protein ACRD22_00600 [Terriglobia bacterium]
MAKQNIADKERARNRDLLEQWRALRRAGVYDTKEKATIKGLTPNRRKAITKKFNSLQGLGTYQQGVIYRPLHKLTEERPVYKRDEMGRQKFLRTQKTERYVLDKDHFQVFKRKPKAVPGDSLKTPKGMIAPKFPDERLRITKDGKVKVTEKKEGKPTTEFTREPLSGPVEFIAFMNDVLNGRLKFNKNEGVVLISNGFRQRIIGQSAVMQLAYRLQRYAAGEIFRHTRGRHERGSFDDWSSNSEIALYRRK